MAHASIHPCKHSATLKKIIDQMESGDGPEMRPGSFYVARVEGFLSVGGVGWRCKWCWSCCFQVHAVCGGALGQDIFVAHGAQRVVLVQAQGVLP